MHWIDPAHLPDLSGHIEAVIYNDRGEADGVLLDDDREVHIPPHLFARTGRALRVGEPLTVHYLRARGSEVSVAVALTLPSGKQVQDDGPHDHTPAEPPAMRPVHLTGQVQALIHAPRGEVSGARLDNGAIVRFHPKGNDDIAAYFEPGSSVEVWGQGFKKQGTTVIQLEHVAAAASASA